MGASCINVGLMVYNEERHLERTLDSILKQSVKDYDIIVADNASTDGTSSIMERYRQKDARIQYTRHERNIGAIRNFNWLVNRVDGEYFVLASGHDLWSENYLEELIGVLDGNNDAVLAYAPTVWVDDEGRRIDRRMGYIDTSDKKVLERFNLAMWSDQHALYGMYRLSALRKTRRSLEIVGSGGVLLSELAILGTFVVAPEARWYRRIVRESETRDQKMKRYAGALFVTGRMPVLPHWRIPLAYLGAAWRADTRTVSKLKLLASSASTVIRYGGDMLSDVREMSSRLVAVASLRRGKKNSPGGDRDKSA